MDESERIKRVHEVGNELGVDFGRDALSIVHELREFLKSVVDEGTHMDSGGGMGASDLWFTVGGQEYLMTVKPCLPAPPTEQEQ